MQRVYLTGSDSEEFVQAKDLDELKAWKSTVSGKLDDLIKENQEMRQVPFPGGGQ
jgi:hypothetical protein